jgi:hypothetical protein
MEIYILVGFVWFIGWAYACGKQTAATESSYDVKSKILSYAILAIAWPFYLGWLMQD